MSSKNKSYRPLIIFYVLAIYVFASFIWWSYLLWKDNQQSFELRISHERENYFRLNGDATSFERSESFLKIQSKYNLQKFMIAGEGIVFLWLMLFGIYKLRKSILKEAYLSRLQNNFLLSITHELKSPLASIKLSIETLKKRVLLEEKKDLLMSNSLHDVNRLESLVNNILFATQIESDSYVLNKEQLNFSVFVHQICKHVSTNHEEHRNFIYHIQSDIFFEFDKMGMNSAITNLLDNAIKYSPPDSTIEIKIFEIDRKVVIQITDQGAGIESDEREKIFQRFYRIGNEETRKTKGTGLGLYLTKYIVDKHGGRVHMEDHKLTGSVFIVELPK